MEKRPLGSSGLAVSAIGLGCYGMSGVYGRADDAESVATIRRALDLGVTLLDTSASYGEGHNHRLIAEALRGRREDIVVHTKSGSPRGGEPDGVRGGGDPVYLRQICEESLRNLGTDRLDVFCMSRVDPNVPVEEGVGGMARLVEEGKARFIGLSECSTDPLRRGSTVWPLVSLQMEYSLFSREAESQGQLAACRDEGAAFMAYAVLGRGLIAERAPSAQDLQPGDSRARLPRFQTGNFETNASLRARLADFAARRGLTLPQLAIAWTLAQGRAHGVAVVPIPGAKTRAHLEENLRASSYVLDDAERAEIDALAPPGAVAGTRYPEAQMRRLNL